MFGISNKDKLYPIAQNWMQINDKLYKKYADRCETWQSDSIVCYVDTNGIEASVDDSRN